MDINQRISQLRPTGPFVAWTRSQHFAANLRFLYARVMAAYAE
jgi:hypothetical protein